jgi:hypothetical protein
MKSSFAMGTLEACAQASKCCRMAKPLECAALSALFSRAERADVECGETVGIEN